MAKALAKVTGVEAAGSAGSTDTEQQKASQLPVPKGYKILIGLPEPEKASEGGILKAE